MVTRGFALLMCAVLFAGCTGPSPEPSPQSPAPVAVSPAPTPSLSAQPTSTIDITQAIDDPSAGGELIDVDVTVDLAPPSPDRFYWLDPFGNVVDGTFDPSRHLRLQPIDGSAAVDFGTVPWVGRAAAPGANGTYGETAFLDGVLVWQSRDETTELLYDSYDVFALAEGGMPIKIGESTVDDPSAPIGEQMYSAPGDGNYLTIAADRAWWVDGRPGPETDGHWTSSIYSAPLNGSSPQVEELTGARMVKSDYCSSNAAPALTYAVDTMSTADLNAPSQVWATSASDSLTSSSPRLVWEKDGTQISSYDTCGQASAVGYSISRDNDENDGFVDVTFNGTTITIAMGTFSSAGRVTVVPTGAFFFNWGVPERQYYWSDATQTLYDIGVGVSFGAEATPDGSRVVMAHVGDYDDEGSTAYTPRVVTFAP